MSVPNDDCNQEEYQSHYDDDHDDGNNSDDGDIPQGIDRVRFPASLSYRSDAQRSDTATVCSGSVLEDIEVESVMSAQDDVPHHIASTTENRSSFSTTGTLPDQRSGDMFPPLNRAFLLERDLARSSSDSNVKFSIAQSGLGRDEDGNITSYHSNGVHRNSYTPIHLHSDILPVGTATNTINNAIRRYIDEVKPQAPSSVKSFGSNVGSDDCGGSLDVETHSVGARSIHSQEDILPVAMPDPDPETVAVASLSINPVYDGELPSPSGNLYKGLSSRSPNGRYMHLTLERFHNNQVQFDDFDENGFEGSRLDHATGNNPQSLSLSRENDDGRPANWNDPRIDDQPREKFRHEATNPHRRRTRSRSRSRSPPR